MSIGRLAIFLSVAVPASAASSCAAEDADKGLMLVQWKASITSKQSERVEEEAAPSYLVDNSKLDADTQGLGYRHSKDLEDRVKVGDVDKIAAWGTTVRGIDLQDGWLQVGELFLPKALGAIPVVVAKQDADGSLPSGTPGNAARLDETGFRLVRSLKSDLEMKNFIHRLVQAEARYVTDAGKGDLNGLVPFYSGTADSRSFANLKQELREKTWVADGEGKTAPLNEVGYQRVAKRNSRPHMKAYLRRVLSTFQRKCIDEAALSGMVPYYDGEVSVQSFEALQHELFTAKWSVPW